MALMASSLVVALTLSAAAANTPPIESTNATPVSATHRLEPRMRVEAPLSSAWRYDLPEKRPAALPALYAALGALNALDVYSTRKAIGAGALEANPLMRTASGRPATMLAVKAAATASTIYFTERTWKKNRKAAIVMAAVINGATAAIVARNLRNARQ